MIEDLPIPALFAKMKKYHVKYLEKNIKLDDVQTAQFIILVVLSKHDKITQKELADHLSYSEGLITRFLKQLEQNNYIHREIDENNKRKKIITITQKGIDLAEEIEKYNEIWEKEVFKFLNEDEFKTLTTNLYRAVENSEKYVEK